MAQPTPAQMSTLLIMLKSNLELITDYLDPTAKADKETELEQYIHASVSYIEREGISLNCDNIDDCMLVVMYSNWLYDRRKDGVAVMPRMLRYNLNNRLFAQKV